MTIRRRRLWYLSLAGLVLAGGGCLYLSSSRALWVQDKERVTSGMTRDQVVAAFGGPPDVDLVYMQRADWIAMDGRIFVQFGGDHRVVYCQYSRVNVFVWQFRRLR